MKKLNLRSISWILLIGFSLSCYIYLKNIPTDQYQEYIVEESIDNNDEADMEETKVLLPDIVLVKKIIDVTRVILHGH